MMEDQNKYPQKPRPKRDIARYFLVIPLVILAGWLLQRSPLFDSDKDERKEYQQEMAEDYLQEKLVAMEKELAEKDKQKSKDFKLNLNINGDQITIENLDDLKQLENLGKEFEKLGRELEKQGDDFEKNFKEVFVKELNKSIREWKKEDLPKLKEKIKKLKKVLGKELKEDLAKELKNVDSKDLNENEKELLKHLTDLIGTITEE